MKDLSYALGMMVANDFKKGVFKSIDVNEFATAMKSVFNNENTRISADEANQIINTFYRKAQLEAADLNKKAGDAYLAENKKREGVIVTASGLQYEILQAGTGAKPMATDTVRCHYEGTLLDGTVFDSSFRRGTPAEFPLNQVIAGWTEGVQLMREGATFKFYIPYPRAYGERGAGADIPPYAALIFTVELIKVL